MQARDLHTLEPLTHLTPSKLKFKYIDVKQKAFEEMKRIFPRKTLLAYTDLNKQFEKYTNDSDLQLGSIFSQEVKLIAFIYQRTNRTSKILCGNRK